MSIRAFSFGGGTQSVGALVLAAQGKLDYRLFILANVGEDSEYPGTLRYFHEHALPFAEAHDLELVEVRKIKRNGEPDTVRQRITRAERSIPIPMRLGPDAVPANRACTAEFKIRIVEKELRRRGATLEDRATVGIGITTDEIKRVGAPDDPRTPYQRREYPLVKPLGLSRADCAGLIREAGLPLPPRSACSFCPLHTAEEWRKLARRDPDLFEDACGLEDTLRERARKHHGTDAYLTRYGVPLRDLGFGDEGVLFDDDEDRDAGCDSGYCMT